MVPASSRSTVDVNSVVGTDLEVAAKVVSDRALVCERPMYFRYQDKWTGGSDVMAADAPAGNWYFAEGYTGPGFDTWICVLNPGDRPAGLTFRFQTQEAGEMVRDGLEVGAHSRRTFKANELLGPDYQFSLALSSDKPVVAERPVYFDYCRHRPAAVERRALRDGSHLAGPRVLFRRRHHPLRLRGVADSAEPRMPTALR